MKMSEIWHDVMDKYKLYRSVCRFPETVALYGRAEMVARAECEMAEALEKMGVKP